MSQRHNDSLADTGSSHEDEPVFLVVGQLGKPHGIRGEISFRAMTDFPDRLTAGKTLHLGEDKLPYTLRQVRGGGAKLIFAFDGLSDRNEAAMLRNLLVFVRSDEIPELDDGDFYYHDLIGLRVITDEGAYLGTLEEIIDTKANDVFVVRSEEGTERLLPAIDEVVLSIDLDEEKILVHLLNGL